MCGIIGYTGRKNAAEIVYKGLKRLEYRGYDSAGAAFISDSKIKVIKKCGKVEKIYPETLKISSDIGIGHTRWATHGAPSDVNAHPHVSGDIAIVHNGIIENYSVLKEQLVCEGVKFTSQTDSEVIAHLIDKYYDGDLLLAVSRVAQMLEGSYALMAISGKEKKIVAAKYKSPLIIGYGLGESFCASDEYALAGLCDRICILEDGDIAEITPNIINIYAENLNLVIRNIEPNLAVSEIMGLGDCPHYMLKEIRETPLAAEKTAQTFRSVKDKLKDIFSTAERVVLTGCGTAYHAALVGKRYLEKYARISAEAETAGEFRYKDPVIDEKTVVIAVSQSGETADTVEAARLCKTRGAKIIALTNCLHSQLTRLADVVVPVAAGPEICVAATKSYTGQVAALYFIAKTVCGKYAEGVNEFEKIPRLLRETVENIDIGALAGMCASMKGVYFLGRDIDYAVALEGSLKLKEVSYVPGEGYPAGELKHGTLALVDGNVAAVFIICNEALADKCINAVEQVRSRGGRTAVFTNIADAVEKLKDKVDFLYELPACGSDFSPFVAGTALQKLAYETAVILGRDPDKPRNLAKSVTVE